MKLSPGAQAPSFTLPDLHGQGIGLEQFRGRKRLLSFYRYASCPFCNLRVHQLSRKAPEWWARVHDHVDDGAAVREVMGVSCENGARRRRFHRQSRAQAGLRLR